MLATIAMVLMAATPASDCTPDKVDASLQAATDAQDRKDDKGAKAAIAPAAACPITTSPIHIAHVIAADIAAAESDWRTVRSLLIGAPIHSDMATGAHVQFLRMRADQGIGDGAAFAADRAATVAAYDAKLTAAGGKPERFRVPGAEVAAYRAAFTQTHSRRVLEFIAVPDDRTLYPVSILLGDDRHLAARRSTSAGGSAHVWSIDLFTCMSSRSLASVEAPEGGEPSYDAVKARVVEALSQHDAFPAARPDREGCPNDIWLMPGFGPYGQAPIPARDVQG